MHSERRGSGIKQLRLPAFQLRFCPSPKHRSSLCVGSPNPDSRNYFDPDFLRAWHQQLKIVVRPVIPQYRFDKTKEHTLRIVTTYSSARTILCVLFVYSLSLLLHPNHIPFFLCFLLPNPDIFSQNLGHCRGPQPPISSPPELINSLCSLTGKQISEKCFTYRSVQVFKILFRGFYSPESHPPHDIMRYWFYY